MRFCSTVRVIWTSARTTFVAWVSTTSPPMHYPSLMPSLDPSRLDSGCGRRVGGTANLDHVSPAPCLFLIHPSVLSASVVGDLQLAWVVHCDLSRGPMGQRVNGVKLLCTRSLTDLANLPYRYFTLTAALSLNLVVRCRPITSLTSLVSLPVMCVCARSCLPSPLSPG